MDVKRFEATAVSGKSLVVYVCSPFERYNALGAWKRRWAVLNQWCVGILRDTRFADKHLVLCEQELIFLLQVARRH